MKILYFTCGQSPHDLRFLQALSTTKHQVGVLCLDGGAGYRWPQGIEPLTWPEKVPPFSWITARRLAALFKQVTSQFMPDVVHVGPIPSSAYIAALSGWAPILSMSWGSDLLMDAEKDAFQRQAARFALAHTTLLAADCQTVVAAARKHGFSGPTSIFPWGVDLTYFMPGSMGTLRKKLGWQGKTIFLSNRTVEKLYGVDIVAKAFASAAVKDTDLRLLLFGKGSQEVSVYKTLHDAGVADRVHFGGFAGLEELPDVYRSADYYVSASHSDGSSVSLMEALACGLPALVSDIPSNREWIEMGRQGWLFTDGRVNELAECMLLAAASTQREQLSQAARNLAEFRADWKKNFSILLTAYEDAVRINLDRKSSRVNP